jgi:hypothetical protein
MWSDEPRSHQHCGELGIRKRIHRSGSAKPAVAGKRDDLGVADWTRRVGYEYAGLAIFGKESVFQHRRFHKGGELLRQRGTQHSAGAAAAECRPRREQDVCNGRTVSDGISRPVVQRPEHGELRQPERRDHLIRLWRNQERHRESAHGSVRLATGVSTYQAAFRSITLRDMPWEEIEYISIS